MILFRAYKHSIELDARLSEIWQIGSKRWFKHSLQPEMRPKLNTQLGKYMLREHQITFPLWADTVQPLNTDEVWCAASVGTNCFLTKYQINPRHFSDTVKMFSLMNICSPLSQMSPPPGVNSQSIHSQAPSHQLHQRCWRKRSGLLEKHMQGSACTIHRRSQSTKFI